MPQPKSTDAAVEPLRPLTPNERRRSNRIVEYFCAEGIIVDNPYTRLHAQLIADAFVRDGWGLRKLKKWVAETGFRIGPADPDSPLWRHEPDWTPDAG